MPRLIRLQITNAMLCCALALGCGDNLAGAPAPPDSPAADAAIPIDPTPAIMLEAARSELAPNGAVELHVVARDGASHPGWSYTFSDGKTGPARGSFQPAVAGDAASQIYTPADCVLLGGGTQTLSLGVVVIDGGSGRTRTGALAVAMTCPEATFYTTKTPYHPRQDLATYEAPPAGFVPVFTELVARHGSRGLSSAKYDLATYAIWQRAQADGALTPLGAQLGPDVMRVMRANALLDVGVPGIKTPGYGNLTQIGIREHKDLAKRLIARLPAYFSGLGSTAGSSAARQLLVVSSGVDRAVDSAGFFAGSLVAEQPSLGPLIVAPPAPIGYPANAPVVQPAGTNRFQLYFHKLVAKTDLVSDPADPMYAVYQSSQAFQSYANDAAMTATVNAILATPAAVSAARAVLERLFTPAFVDKLASATYPLGNTGTFVFTSDDGSFTTTITGDGKTTVKTLTDAVSMLYNLYVIAPAMADELGGDLTAYFPGDSAKLFAYLQDAQDFYQMGPSIAERAPVTYQMAAALEDDFFGEVDAIAAGDLSHGAKLRFTHAEIIVPFAAILGLSFTPVPQAETYDYATNPWRGELVAPLAANIQWDIYRDAAGRVLVKMLYNEQEIDFKPACESARFTYRSHFYDYAKLKTCYSRP
jgi:hypothetical protein